MFKKIGVKFLAVNPNYREHHHKHLKPKELVVFLAIGKARAAAKKHNRAIIVGADTVVEFKGKILGKPKNKKDAKRMLEMQRGKMVSVITGYAVLDSVSHRIISGKDTTKVYFKNYYNELLTKYIATGQPLDKAGAFAVQDMGKALVRKVVGNRDSAIGLPVKQIKVALKKLL